MTLTWSHCIPTLNRIDILEQAVRLSLQQTCPAKEIIIVDAGNQLDTNRARIEAVFAAHQGPKPALHYLASPVKSLTNQRNIATQRATGDILFLFDDDTLMFPDCAEQVLKVYAADGAHQIAAGMASNTPDIPGAAQVSDGDRKVTGVTKASLRDHPALRWVWDHIFLMRAASHFIAYDTPRRLEAPQVVTVGGAQILRVPLLSGYAMTVRASVARAEPFDAALLSYSPAEDLDASYRFSRHGMNVLIETARVHHFEAASGRIKRRQAITLGLMNLAAFVAQKSAAPARDIPAYYLRYLRRVVAEFLKDLLSKRFTFPQFLGALSAFGPTIAIFRHGRTDFDDWYRTQQMRVLGWPQPSTPSTFTSPQNHKG
jgi:glycosyltransferase involved in cell wall biosynthesis